MGPISVFATIALSPQLVRYFTSSASGYVRPKNPTSDKVLKTLHQPG